MTRIIIAPQAATDLDEILNYIACGDPSAAKNLLTKIRGRIASLADHPAMGVTRDELQIGLFVLPIETYLIFYRDHVGHIEIIRVLHSARDIGSALFGKR